MNLKLERTDRVRYTFEIVGLTVRKVVHRIDLPFRACTVVRMRGDDTVHDRITEMHVRIRHIDLRTEYHLTFLYLAALHSLKETQVFFYRTVAVRRSYTGFGRRTFLLCDLLGCLLIHVSFALFDEHDGEVVELLEVIGSIEYLSPFETEPSDIALDGLYILGVLFGRVGVVETEVTNTVVFLGDTEVHTDGFDVADMQVTVRLRRETGLDTSAVHSLREVFLSDLLNEIERFFFFACRHDCFFALNRQFCFFHIFCL